MRGLFNIENPVWNFIGKLADMVILSCLWLLTSLPVLTIGASTAALYAIAKELADNQEGYLIRQFFQAFKENLKQGTRVGTVVLLSGIIMAGDLFLACHMSGTWGKILFWALISLFIVYLLTLTILFPLMVRYQTGMKQLLAAAFVIAFRQLGWTLFMAVSTVCLISIGLFVLAPFLFLAPGLIAYLHSKILNFIFKENPLCYIQN